MDSGGASCGLTVRLQDLTLLAFIGINPDEIGQRQPLVIGVELALSVEAGHSIEETIDYRRIAQAAEALAETHIALIESFAWLLATECLSWSLVEEARVTVEKPLGRIDIRVRLSRKWWFFLTRSAAYSLYVSTGSPENRHLQASIT